MEKVLGLHAACTGLCPREVDAVDDHDQIIALLAAAQGNAVCPVNVHAMLGRVHEPWLLCRLLIMCVACCICEALYVRIGTICSGAACTRGVARRHVRPDL